MSNLGLTCVVSNIVNQDDFLVRHNIKKYVVFPSYRGNLGEQDVPIAYVGSKEIAPQLSLETSTFDDVLENGEVAFEREIQWGGQTLNLESSDVLITNVIASYSSDTHVPFYWKHIIPNNDAVPDSIKILNSDLEEMPSSSYEIIRINSRDSSEQIQSGIYEEVAIYSNYQNIYNVETGEYTVYYVRYQSDGSHYQILNQIPAFRKATYEDISLLSGTLKHWRKVYSVSPSLNGYEISVPSGSGVKYTKRDPRNRIILKETEALTDDSPWFMKVSNGSFSRSSGGYSYFYSVPEFEMQSFVPIYPYKYIGAEEVLSLGNQLLKISHTPLRTDSDKPIDVIVRESNGSPIYALTNDSSKNGTIYYENGVPVTKIVDSVEVEVLWDSTVIDSYDELNGFILLNRKYPSRYLYYVSYYYEESNFSITSVNLNPAYSEEYDGELYVFYCVPTGGKNGNTGRTNSIHYLKINRNGQIIRCSQDGLDGNLNFAGLTRRGNRTSYYSKEVTGYVAGAATVRDTTLTISDNAFLYDTSGNLKFPKTGVIVIGSNDINQSDVSVVGYSAITDLGSTLRFTLDEPLPNSHSTLTPVRLLSFKYHCSTLGTNNLQWLVLGETVVKNNERPENLAILDIRKRGGVIKEKHYTDAMALDARSIWARPGMFRTKGQPFPGYSTVVVKVPYTLLTEYGGSFSRFQIEDVIAKRHLAVGVMPIVYFDGHIPQIQDLLSTSSSITVSWDHEGTGFTYNVYISLDDINWTKDNSAAISGTGTISYTITSLTNGRKYYVCLTSIYDSIESPKSQRWAIRTL